MDQFTIFISQEWLLASAFVVLLIIIIIWELRLKKIGPQKLSPQAAVQLINQQRPLMIDIRDLEAFKQGHIVGSTQTPQSQLVTKLSLETRDKPILLICQTGMSATTAAALLRKQGFAQVYILAGGINAWTADNFPLSKK